MFIHEKTIHLTDRAQEEVRQMAQKARDEIGVKVGWMIRSSAQIRRYRNAAKIKQGD